LRGSEGADAVRAEAEYQDIKNIVIHERQTARSNTYFSMLFGIGSGKLHTGRRVQLVIWLQIMQEWVGIAGVTVYAPTIFRIAGFASEKSQYVSFDMVPNHKRFADMRTPAQMDQRLEQHLLHALDTYLRVHTRPYRSTIHPVSANRSLRMISPCSLTSTGTGDPSAKASPCSLLAVWHAPVLTHAKPATLRLPTRTVLPRQALCTCSHSCLARLGKLWEV
jgi:hypothetical protein